jgi:hypothetical protein
MSSTILTIMKTQPLSTFQEVADEVVREVGSEIGDSENERTLRRRVYDVLNVFVAAGLVEKDGKTVRYRGSAVCESCGSSVNSLRQKVHNLEIDLQSKVRVLIGWELMVFRNRVSCESPSLKVPVKETFFFGFRESSVEYYDQALDGRKITIHCHSSPGLFSPLEVIDKVGFNEEDRFRILEQHEELRSLLPVVFPNYHERFSKSDRVHTDCSPELPELVPSTDFGRPGT